MAVTLTVTDLEQPIGELSAHYFPQGDMDDLLDGWLDAATAKVEADSNIATANHDSAAAAYVYYRAYDYIATQLAAMPNQASEGDGAISVTISDGRILAFRALAAAKLAEYGALQSANSLIGTHFTLASGRRGL